MLTTILFGLFAAAAEVAGGSLIILRKEWPRKVQEYLLALSAGFLLALVFFDLLPESMNILGSSAPIFMILGFGFLHFFEHTIVGHLHFGEETHSEAMISHTAGISTFGGLFIHAFFDGIAISAGIQYNFTLGVLIFLAIFLHKLPEGLTIASVMLAAHHPKRTAFIASVASGFATILGTILILFLANVHSTAVGIAFAFSAGTATYVGASDLIPEVNRSGNRITPLVVFGGMLLFYLSKLLMERIIR